MAEGSLLQAFAAHRVSATGTSEVYVAERIDGLADAARSAGLTPEALVIMVKRIARDAGWISVLGRDSGRTTNHVPRQQLDAAVSRAIVRYFRPS